MAYMPKRLKRDVILAVEFTEATSEMTCGAKAPTKYKISNCSNRRSNSDGVNNEVMHSETKLSDVKPSCTDIERYIASLQEHILKVG